MEHSRTEHARQTRLDPELTRCSAVHLLLCPRNRLETRICSAPLALSEAPQQLSSKRSSKSSSSSSFKMTSQLQYYQSQLEKMVDQPGVVNDLLTQLETKTKVKKIYLAYGECRATTSTWMME